MMKSANVFHYDRFKVNNKILSNFFFGIDVQTFFKKKHRNYIQKQQQKNLSKYNKKTTIAKLKSKKKKECKPQMRKHIHNHQFLLDERVYIIRNIKLKLYLTAQKTSEKKNNLIIS